MPQAFWMTRWMAALKDSMRAEVIWCLQKLTTCSLAVGDGGGAGEKAAECAEEGCQVFPGVTSNHRSRQFGIWRRNRG